MVYALSVVAALAVTFCWALCRAAGRADAAAVGWHRRRQPPDEELDELVATAVEEVRGVRSD